MTLRKGFLWFILLALSSMIIFSGCVRQEKAEKEREIVTRSKVESFKKAKNQRKLDIFIPLKEQYKTSKHSDALTTLRKAKNQKPFCYDCHSATYRFASKDAKPDPATVNNSITCYVCHELTIDEFKLRLDPLEACVSCHNAVKITPGQEVYHPQKEMFLGTGALGVPNMPDEKYQKGLTCIECHMPNKSHNFEGITPREAIKENKESVCILCHTDVSEEQFAKDIDRIQTEIKGKLNEAKKELKTVKKAMDDARAKGRDIASLQPLYDMALTNISFVEHDKSKGVHNYKYSKEILKVARNKLNEIKNQLK